MIRRCLATITTPSVIAFFAIAVFLFTFRINTVHEKETGWDILGYYLWLPATFIHHDPMLNDIGWLQQLNEEKQLTGTLYIINYNKQGEPMYLFLMGMSLFYLPFFFAGHGVAHLSGFPADGFSMPYQYALVVGGILYAIIGLFFLRKILRHFFSEWVTVLIMVMIVFGTNYIHHQTTDNLGTSAVLFMLMTIVLWNTLRWHAEHRNRHLVTGGVAIVLMALVKPTEILAILIPVLWNATSWEGLKTNIRRILSARRALLALGVLALVILFPQMLYWYLKTGNIIYNSYHTPGNGLDLLHPNIIKVLFSYKRGWLLYTPVMIFALAGFWFLWKENRKIFLACSVYFLVALYLISSWAEWWYGGTYSCRPIITSYPLLAISMGYFIGFVKGSRWPVKLMFGLLTAFFIFLNQFQWWQLRNYILEPYRMTRGYYWRTFLKTAVYPEDRELLSVDRNFSGVMKLQDEGRYGKSVLFTDDFLCDDQRGFLHENGNCFLRLDTLQEYYTLFKAPYGTLTEMDHLWIRAGLRFRFPAPYDGPMPCLVITMEGKRGSFGYFTAEMRCDTTSGGWQELESEYLTPEVLRRRDRLHFYIWKRGNHELDIDQVHFDRFDPK